MSVCKVVKCFKCIAGLFVRIRRQEVHLRLQCSIMLHRPNIALEENLYRGVAVSFTVKLEVCSGLYSFEKTASLPVTDNRSLEKACNITVKNFVCSQDPVSVSCVCWCHGAVLAVSDHRFAGEPSFYWYQVTVLTDVTVHFVCWHVYALLPFYVLVYLLMPYTNTV